MGIRNWHCYDVNCDCAGFAWAWMLPVPFGKFRRCPYCNRQLGDMQLGHYRLVRAVSFGDALAEFRRLWRAERDKMLTDKARDALLSGSAAQLRLQLGELTAGELRVAQAVVRLAKPNEREREILQCMVDAWVDSDDMAMPGDFSYAEVIEILARLGLSSAGLEGRVAGMQAMADRERDNEEAEA